MFFSAVAQAGTQAAGHPIRDVVTFWLAILGFLLSVYNLAVTIYTNHKRISICVKAVYSVSRLRSRRSSRRHSSRRRSKSSMPHASFRSFCLLSCASIMP